MDVLQTIAGLASEQVAYLRCDPLIHDFTEDYDGKFIILTPTRSVSFSASDLGLTTQTRSFFHILQYTFFAKGHIILTWDIKKINSFFRYRLGMPLEPPEAHVIDLKYGLAYQGHRTEKPPESIKEALAAAKTFTTKSQWKLIQSHVFDPLSWKVLPDLETKGFIDAACKAEANQKKVLFASYEVEGTVNGRLSAKKPSDKFLTVHSLSPEQKAVIRPRKYQDGRQWKFIVMDYTNMEVSVLAWLAKDESLQAAIINVEDFYTSLIPIDILGWDRRKLGKRIFLPVMYGLQSRNLAESLKIPQSAADIVIDSLKDRFPRSFEWMELKEAELSDKPLASDYFGRKRDFTGVPSYKRRNFEVASPASLICLERLCALYNAVPDNILIHIHDGYVLVAPLRSCLDIIHTTRDILESESMLSPGLLLKTTCQVGDRLDRLQNVYLPRN